ncbi:MAG TPA: DNA-formamidopyrimidine glycosylase family protein [Acidimicrobiales bacterium]|nr:DNA-formamidopyrimidine glycosylase family protein [Acidimicrobiales bacterium]
MPELPEVEALARFLDERIVGRAITKARVAHIAALKTYDPPIESLEGRTVERVTRRGKYVQVSTGDIWLVTHLARGGWIKWHDIAPTTPIKPTKSPLAFRVVLDNKSGFDMTEMGTEKRLSVWVVRDPNDIEFVSSLGPEALDPAFSREVLADLLRHAGSVQLKGALVDQRLIAGIGNAYSDDIVHAAKLSPFKRANKLTDDELTRLHTALRDVLTDAVERSLGLPAAGLKQEKRSGMRVHARTGLPCPVCGDAVREVSFATKSLQYCATCQTDGKPLADRRLSRLLK